MTIQEEMLAQDPTGFRMLVACVLLNVTTGTAVRPVLAELFRRWPDPHSLAVADRGELEDLLRPLGLWRARAEKLKAFAGQWELKPLRRHPGSWRLVPTYRGLGRYAADSWRVFAEGDTSQPRRRGRFERTSRDKVIRRRLRELRVPAEPGARLPA